MNDPFTQMTHSLEWPIYLNDPFTCKPLSADPFTWMMPIHSNDPFMNDPFTQMTHLLEWPIHEWPIHSNDPFTWMTHSLKWPIHLNDLSTQRTHLLEWPIHSNDPFSWMTHSLKWPICSWPILLNDHSFEWPIYSNDPFVNDPFTCKPLSVDLFTWMTPIHSNDPFTQMTHLLEWPICEWPIHSNDPFTWMTHPLKWPICSNDPFAIDPFTWMTHSLEWPIHLNDPFACRGEMSVYLSYRNNTIWSYEASNVIKRQSCVTGILPPLTFLIPHVCIRSTSQQGSTCTAHFHPTLIHFNT